MSNINVIQGVLNFSVYEPPSAATSCAGDIGRSARISIDVNGRPIGQPDSFYTTSGNTVIDSASYVDNTLWGGIGYYSLGGSSGLGEIEGPLVKQPGGAEPLNTRFWLNLDTLNY